MIINENPNTKDVSSNGKIGDVTNNPLDASWIILFETDGEKYTITNRGLCTYLRVIKSLHSLLRQSRTKYMTATGQLVKDKVSIMNFNTQSDALIKF